MRDRIRLNRPRGRKHTNSVSPWVWLIVALAAFVLLVGGGVVAVVVLVNKGQLNLPGGGMAGLGDSNPKVNAANYGSLYNGETLSEVEGILGGSGRAMNTADLDAICGTEVERYTNPFFKERGMWEINSRNGLVQVWANGNVRIICTFSQPGTGGQLLRKAIKDTDGSVTSESGSMFGPRGQFPPNLQPQVPGQNNPRPGFGKAANPVAPTWQQLIGTWECVDNPSLRYRFTSNQQIGFSVAGNEHMLSVVNTSNANGLFTPSVTLGEHGDPRVHTPVLGSFWFENGTLYNGLQENGTPTKMALRKVN